MVVNQRQGGVGIGEILAKMYNIAVRRYRSSGDLMHSIVTIVNNTELCTSKLLRDQILN